MKFIEVDGIILLDHDRAQILAGGGSYLAGLAYRDPNHLNNGSARRGATFFGRSFWGQRLLLRISYRVVRQIARFYMPLFERSL